MSLRILGTGSALPALVKTNDDLATFLDTSDEWITTRTGIKERHWMDGETLTDLAVLAAKRALEDAGVQPLDIGLVLVATVGGEYVTPPLGCLVQAGIGAACPAFDLNAACSGFLYALEAAAGALCRGRGKVLVVAAEGLSRLADMTDRATAVLFGDGAGALVCEAGDNMPYIHLSSEGFADILNIPYVNGNMPKSQTPNRRDRPAPFLRMNGGEVYKFAVNAIAEGVQGALAATGLSIEDIDHVLIHQANARIVEAARKKLGVPAERCPMNIDHVGNMSAASIAVLLDECNQKGLLKRGQTLLLSAFGGGMTAGTAIIKW